MDPHLKALESQTIYIIREAFNRVAPMGMLWSIGKDSTALLWMVRKAFFGRVPFPVILLDTEMEMDEVYAFRDRLIAEWNLDCINHLCPPEEYMDQTLPPNTRAAMRKTEGLKTLLNEYEFKGIIAGIRRDEQGLRAKERVFSPALSMEIGILRINRPSSGINIKPMCRMARICAFILSCNGRRLISGATSNKKTFQAASFISRRMVCATVPLVRKILQSRCQAMRRQLMKLSKN